MSSWALIVGAGLGIVAVLPWRIVLQQAQSRRLFGALSHSVNALITGEAFFRSYLALLGHVAVFVFWILLGLTLSLAPAVGLFWFDWNYWQDQQTGFWLAYAATSMLAFLVLSRVFKSTPSEDALVVDDSQFFLIQISQNASWVLQKAGRLESRWLGQKLQEDLDRPVFITGLARAGTTMLLELLAQVPDVATHRYRDFPFLMTPWFWNAYLSVFGTGDKKYERPHQDGILISPNSPEALEEPLWQYFFPQCHQSDQSHLLSAETEHPEFERTFRDHLKKILWIRRGQRYVSKGNYNITRLPYLARLFPDARFVIPIRHPVAHVHSLVRQHQLFSDYAENDSRVPEYLKAAGHYEFGPQRVPIAIEDSAEQTRAAWEVGDQYLGYAYQWNAVYGHLAQLLDDDPDLAKQIHVVVYEELCVAPQEQLQSVLNFAELPGGEAVLANLQHIKPSRMPDLVDGEAERIWFACRKVAERFGYQQP